jgi:hypothetical protein
MKKQEAAMQAMKAAIEELNEMTKRGRKEISAAMQAFETKVAALRC